MIGPIPSDVEGDGEKFWKEAITTLDTQHPILPLSAYHNIGACM
jgi:hypothetical protein